MAGVIPTILESAAGLEVLGGVEMVSDEGRDVAEGPEACC